MISEEFSCAVCKGVFKKTHSHEEEVAEYEKYFGTYRQEDAISVCDDCWEQIHPEKWPHEVERAVAEQARQLPRGLP